MTDIYTIAPGDVSPDREAVLQLQGVPPDRPASPATEGLLRAAIAEYLSAAEPRVIIKQVSKREFTDIYHGEGRNEVRTPVEEISPRAAALALFVVTLGRAFGERTQSHFEDGGFPLAYMLDSVGSAAADNTAEWAQRRFASGLQEAGPPGEGVAVLRYSPGYCGWHVTGQRRLFEFIKPDRIGVSLNESCLMQPLKSVSGVLIAGQRDIHDFEPSFPSCKECETKGCRARIRRLFAE